jgi:hypothetical protein
MALNWLFRYPLSAPAGCRRSATAVCCCWWTGCRRTRSRTCSTASRLSRRRWRRSCPPSRTPSRWTWRRSSPPQAAPRYTHTHPQHQVGHSRVCPLSLAPTAPTLLCYDAGSIEWDTVACARFPNPSLAHPHRVRVGLSQGSVRAQSAGSRAGTPGTPGTNPISTTSTTTNPMGLLPVLLHLLTSAPLRGRVVDAALLASVRAANTDGL